MSDFTTFVASFGSSETGLGTVGYEQVGAAGASIVARTTVGVYEIGGGAYGVEVALNIATKSLVWDTGAATPIFAIEDLLEYFNKKCLTNRQETNPGTGRRRIVDDDNATDLVEGPIFEDVAGTTPYSATSNGIDRTDRMT
jgi:hypothetical protein